MTTEKMVNEEVTEEVIKEFAESLGSVICVHHTRAIISTITEKNESKGEFASKLLFDTAVKCGVQMPFDLYYVIKKGDRSILSMLLLQFWNKALETNNKGDGEH